MSDSSRLRTGVRVIARPRFRLPRTVPTVWRVDEH
ncbi:hypothetical protein H4W34_003218 [Actinomadura algeriensis]|uniref:Uncharacterized protein n=1 Tax=Actinomadura algeriensis TaxID=1679523 RepID=A0ABR9JTF1_9ACTN|nr:hypothetical protein [Actinomadura algeriensis]